MSRKPPDVAISAEARVIRAISASQEAIRRRVLRLSPSETVNWWDLWLPGKRVARIMFGSIPGRIRAIYTAPAWMSPPERLLLYTVVYALRPKRSLEIGTFYGGSATLIVAALDDIGEGSLECVDLAPRVAARHLRRIKHRARIHAVRSPEGLRSLVASSEDRFNFALIDGDHSYESVVRDIEGVIPLLADDAVLLFHDAHYHGVAQAIDAMLESNPALVDCGMISTLEAIGTEEGSLDHAGSVTWGGLRMLRWRGSEGKTEGQGSAYGTSTRASQTAS